MITTDAYGKYINEKTYSGAAAKKMVSISLAMRTTGHRAIVVSLPFVGTRAKRASYPSVVLADYNVPFVFLPTLRSKYLRKIIIPFYLAAFAAQKVAPNDTVILYNHAIEYLLAVILLRLRRVHIVQDIEDAPAADERGLRALINRSSFALTLRLTHPRKMVVAESVAYKLNLADYVVVRGAAAPDPNLSNMNTLAKWSDLQGGGEFKVHYGGTLTTDTGVDIFCEAIKRLASIQHLLPRKITLLVTGTGDIEKINSLKRLIVGYTNIQLGVFQELSSKEYSELLNQCHASLSLKSPESTLSETTFPSKVIEITSAGLALISSTFGDVATLFSEDSAFFMTRFDADGLVDILLGAANDCVRVEKVAKAGFDACLRMFSNTSVGQQMSRLL